MPFNPSVSGGTINGYPNPQFFLGNFSTDPANTSAGQWWYNTTTEQIKCNINGIITVISTSTPIKTDSNGNILANLNAQNITPNAIQIGYPSAEYYLGAVSTDPSSSSSGQWWYNTTTMQVKGNVNGTVQVFGAFAGSFSSTTYITNNTTIGGTGITVNYVNLVVSNNAILTIASGSNVNVAGVVNITAGASLVLQGATMNIYNALQNAGTFQSTSSSDSIQAVQVQNTGVIQVDGTLYLPSAGYNHILAGSITGSGTLNIQGTAITLIGDSLQLSVSTVNGNGTYQIQQNGVCTVNGNVSMAIPTITGNGQLAVASGYTLTANGTTTFSTNSISVSGTFNIASNNVTLSPTSLTGTGVLSVASGYTLTLSLSSVSISTISISGTLNLNNSLTLTGPTISGTGTLSVSSGYTLTIGNNASLSVSTVSGAGTLTVSSGYTLAVNGNSTFSIATVSGSGTLSVSSGYTLTIGANTTFSIPTISGAGTIAFGTNTITISENESWNITGISGTGTLTINSGYTLTIGASCSFSFGTVSGAGTLTISSGNTLTFSGTNLLPNTLIANGTLALSGNYTLGTNITNGTGTIQVNSGYTLTVSSNITLGFTTVSGAGTLTVASGYTLTQGSTLTISISNINIAGTWANGGYGITIPSGATVSWNVTGSMTTGSPAGTLTVNGTSYWIGNGITTVSSNAQASFFLSLAGTGIFIASPAGQGTGTGTLGLSATSIPAGGDYNNAFATSSGGKQYYYLTTIQGSAVGKYTIGTFDNNTVGYSGWILIYIGTANTNYSVSGNFGTTSNDIATYQMYAFNMSGSAGTITLTGDLYV